MRINILKYIFLVAFIHVINITKAQNNNDFRAWMSFEVNGNISKKLTFSIKAQSRFDQQMTQLRGIYYSVDLSRKIKKKWSIEGGLRFNTSNTWNSLRMRIGFDKKFKLNKTDISLRGLYQVQFNEFGFPENYRNIQVSSARFKIQAERKLVKHLKLKIYSEPLWRKEFGEVYLRRIRNSIGLDYKLNKNLSAEISYLFQPQFSPKKTVSIINLELSYDLPRKKKNDKKKSKEP